MIMKLQRTGAYTSFKNKRSRLGLAELYITNRRPLPGTTKGITSTTFCTTQSVRGQEYRMGAYYSRLLWQLAFVSALTK